MKKWLLYYGAIIAVVAAAIVIFREYIHIKLLSLIPALLSVSLVGQALDTRKLENRRQSFHSMKFRKTAEGGEFDRKDPSEFDTPADRFEEKLFLFFAPWPLPFVFFFSTTVKITASVIIVLLPVIIAIPTFVKESKKNKERRAAIQAQEDKELEEQKRREELGKWK